MVELRMPSSCTQSLCEGALPLEELPHTQTLPSPSQASVLTATSCQWVTHIFFRWVSFLNIPVASRTEISLLFNRL